MLSPPPIKSPMEEHSWVEWFMALWRNSKKFQGYGTTAQRPTNGLDIGDWYIDQTLNKTIWVHSVSPVVWRDGAGTIV